MTLHHPPCPAQSGSPRSSRSLTATSRSAGGTQPVSLFPDSRISSSPRQLRQLRWDRPGQAPLPSRLMSVTGPVPLVRTDTVPVRHRRCSCSSSAWPCLAVRPCPSRSVRQSRTRSMVVDGVGAPAGPHVGGGSSGGPSGLVVCADVHVEVVERCWRPYVPPGHGRVGAHCDAHRQSAPPAARGPAPISRLERRERQARIRDLNLA